MLEKGSTTIGLLCFFWGYLLEIFLNLNKRTNSSIPLKKGKKRAFGSKTKIARFK